MFDNKENLKKKVYRFNGMKLTGIQSWSPQATPEKIGCGIIMSIENSKKDGF